MSHRTGTRAPRTPSPECSARGEGIPPVSDASFTKETHTRSLTQLPILGNMRQWTKASQTNSELHSRHWRPYQKINPSTHIWDTSTESLLLDYISTVRWAKHGHSGSFFLTALSRNDPSLHEVATPWRDVGCFVGVEKPLQFFIVPLKWVISRKCGKKEKEKKKVRTVPWTAESSDRVSTG